MVEPTDGFGTRMRQERRASLGLASRLFKRIVSQSRPGMGLALVGAVLAVPVDVAAQTGGEGFLFRAPRVTLSLHGGFALARGGSDLFDDITNRFTLENDDFGGFTFGGDVGVRAAEQLDVVFSATYAQAGARSEYEEFVDLDDLPIVQDTRLTRVPLTANLRFYLAPRGRTIGRFAWVPSALVPYIGVGAGAIYHEFEQEGSFVDELDPELPIYDDVLLTSSGWSPLAQVLGGFELAVGPRVALMAEGRYLWSSADLDFDFEGFEPIDLAGFQATAGLSFRL